MQIFNQILLKHFCILHIVFFCGFIFFAPAKVLAKEDDGLQQETMLMFVGEEKPMVTVASWQPEDPVAAPALVNIVSREEIVRHGYQTLAELLAAQPGFYLAARGRGTTSYLRGLADAVLFLYDGVPMTTDITRGLSVLDREISLTAVAKVEITYGPGSILWGADAFAGVVNIVPLRGRQFSGTEVSLRGGSDELAGATTSWGKLAKNWDSFISFSGNRQRYHQPDYLIEKSGGERVEGRVEPSDYGEVVATFHYGNWLNLTGRWSGFTRSYTMQNADGTLSWPGEKAAPVNFLKGAISKVVGPSHYTFMGFIQEIDYRVQDADIIREQRSRMDHLEFLWDRRIFSKVLLTAGSSWRKNIVTGAVVRDGFLPDFLSPSLSFFVPQIRQEDFDTERISVFAQGRYRWGKAEWWAGGRYDEQNQYGTTRSYSLGLNWLLSDTLRLKTSYGNAFRSPFSSQIFADQQLEPESILTASVQLSWTPNEATLLELTLFQNRLKDHRVEDPYGGLSEASNQETMGAELVGRLPLGAAFILDAGLMFLDQPNGEEQFSNLQFSFVRPDGTQVSVFDEWSKAFDQGSQWLANIGLDWNIAKNHNLMISGRFSDRLRYSYDKGETEGSYTQPVLIDLTYNRSGFRPGHDTFTLTATNLLDQDYQVSDTFGPTVGPPRRVSIIWHYRF